MPPSKAVSLVREFLFRTGHEDAVPPLDAALVPNDRLDEAPELPGGAIPAPEDVLPALDGALYISTGSTVLRCTGPDFEQRDVHASFEAPAGALAQDRDGDLLVCVAGTGLVRVSLDGRQTVVADSAGGRPLRCLTAIAVGEQGVVYLTEGSTRHLPVDWVWDLMERNALGRLLRYDPTSGETTVLREALRWPAGVCVEPEADALLVSESWSHSVSRHAIGGAGDQRPQPVVANMAGYPGRIHPRGGGGYWLSVFALRTHLVEYVLSEEEYRTEMMRTVDPKYWIRPALRSLDSGLEPLQGGQIRKLGRIKPWAPPRSYGLVVELDSAAQPIGSWHSRADGRHHGVVSARQGDGDLYIAVAGGDAVLRAPVEGMGHE